MVSMFLEDGKERLSLNSPVDCTVFFEDYAYSAEATTTEGHSSAFYPVVRMLAYAFAAARLTCYYAGNACRGYIGELKY